MYKLKYQWLALFALVVSAAIVYYIYPMFKATMFETPVVTFVIGQIGVLLTLAFLFYEKGSLAQQFKAFFLMLSISMGLGALANFLGQSHNICTFVPGATIFHIALKLSWAQLLLMTMAALTTTITLCKLAPVTYIADPDVLNKLKGKGQQMAPVIENTEVAESDVDWETAKDASDLMPKPKPTSSQSGLKAASASQSKLDALEASAPTPSPVAEDAGAPYQDRRGTGASKPSSTADRLQAQKRRNTSTFTKLQALSASGTGSLRKPSALEQQSEEAPQSLSTLLNRLDDEDAPVPAATTTPTATPPKPAQPKPEPIQPPEEILITTLFGEEAQLGLDVAEQTEQGFSLMDRLAAEEEVSGIEVAEPAAAVDEYNIDEPVFNAVDATEAPQAVVEQYNAEQSSSMEPSAVLEETAFAEPAPEPVAEPVVQIAEPVAEAAPVEPEPAPAPPPPPPEPAPVTPPPVTPPAAPVSTPLAETKPVVTTRPPSQQPISVAAGLVQHSSPLAAKESADPGIAPSLMSLLDSAAERAGIDETAPPAAAPPAAAPPPPEPVAPPPAPEAVIPAIDSVAPAAEETESQQKLFSAGLDSDLDDVFSGLAPAEAQREVSASTLPTAEPSSPALEAEPEKKGLFGQEVGSEIDDIFNGLAPPEAQREVSKVSTGDHKPIDVAPEPAAAVEAEPAPVAKAPEPAKAAEPAEAEEQKGLFEAEALSNEIDDIFSGLASPEAQREVADVLKKPPVQPEPESVAPPEDESKGLFQESALNSEIDDIFSGLASADAQRDVSHVTLAQLKGENQGGGSLATGELPQPTPESLSPDKSSFVGTGDVPVLDDKVQAQMAANPRPTKPTDTAGSLPSMPADVVLNPAPATPAASTAETPKAEGKSPTGAVTPPKEVKEFGRLSNRSAVQPKVTGEGAGTMKTVGKLLLDTQAVENIIQAGQTKRPIGSGLTTARVISATRGEGIKALLTRIDTYPGVAGSLIVGHDGLVIASTVTGMDKDMLGALSTALLSTSNLTTKKLEIGKLRQMVLLTEIQNTDGSIQPKTTVLTDVDVGILAVFLEQTELEKLDGLIVEIHETING